MSKPLLIFVFSCFIASQGWAQKNLFQTVPLRLENCLTIQSYSGEVDEQYDCGTVSDLSIQYMVTGDASTWVRLVSARNRKQVDLYPNNIVFGGSPYIQTTALDFYLVNNMVKGVVYRARGNSGESRLVANCLNLENQTTVEIGIFKTNKATRKALKENCH
jgi:hypothetical protein